MFKDDVRMRTKSVRRRQKFSLRLRLGVVSNILSGVMFDFNHLSLGFTAISNNVVFFGMLLTKHNVDNGRRRSRFVIFLLSRVKNTVSLQILNRAMPIGDGALLVSAFTIGRHHKLGHRHHTHGHRGGGGIMHIGIGIGRAS